MTPVTGQESSLQRQNNSFSTVGHKWQMSCEKERAKIFRDLLMERISIWKWTRESSPQVLCMYYPCVVETITASHSVWKSSPFLGHKSTENELRGRLSCPLPYRDPLHKWITKNLRALFHMTFVTCGLLYWRSYSVFETTLLSWHLWHWNLG